MSTATAPAPGTRVELVVPASSANLGPGFDSVGLALGVHDRTVVTVTDEPGVSIDVEGERVHVELGQRVDHPVIGPPPRPPGQIRGAYLPHAGRRF